MAKHYLLRDHADANKMITTPIWRILLFLVIGGFLLLLSSIDPITFGVFAGLAFLLSFVFCIEEFFNIQTFGLYASIEGDALILCTRKGRKLKIFSLRDMNKTYAFVHYGYSTISSEKSLLLFPKEMSVKFSWMKDPALLWFDWKSCNYKKRKQLVIIVNKELEEKILAYYGEQPIN